MRSIAPPSRAPLSYVTVSMAPRRDISDGFHAVRMRLLGYDPHLRDLIDELERTVVARMSQVHEQGRAVADANVRVLEIAEKQRELSDVLTTQNAQLASQSAHIQAARDELERQVRSLAEANVDAVFRIEDASGTISALEAKSLELERTNATLQEQASALGVEAEALARSNADAVALLDEQEQAAREMEERQRTIEVANAELERLAFCDGLTGLFNKRYFQQRIRTTVERAHREQRPLSVIFLDVDHFKRLNDTHGHPMGDVVLRAIGEILRRDTRQAETTTLGEATPIAARYGGEEFVLILPDTSAEGAYVMAERVRAAIEAVDLPCSGGQPLRATVSAGIAQLDATTDATELVRRADTALYRAKAAGRNRVEMFDSVAVPITPPRLRDVG